MQLCRPDSLSRVVAGVKLAHVAGAKQLRYGASVLCILSAVGMVAKSMTS
jgi:hypothetical protein